MNNGQCSGHRGRGSRWRWVLVVVWLGLIVISFWLYGKQGKYLHLLSLDVRASEQQFQIQLESGSVGTQAAAAHAEVELQTQMESAGRDGKEPQTESAGRDDRILQMAAGKVEEAWVGTVQQILLVYDDDAASGIWQVIRADGASVLRYETQTNANIGRWIYACLGMTLLFFGIFIWANPKGRRNQKAARQILGRYEAEKRQKGQRVSVNGAAVFRKGERKRLAHQTVAMGMLVSCGLYFWKGYEIGLITEKGFWLAYLGILFLGLVLYLLLELSWQQAFFEPLTKELRPLTAAEACLLEAAFGDRRPGVQRMMIHNASAGLLRGGDAKLAGLLAEYNLSAPFHLAENQFSKYQVYIRCLEAMGKQELAEQEKKLLEELLQKKPRLKQQKVGMLYCLMEKMKRAWAENRGEQARACGELYLEIETKAYGRLPVLAFLEPIYRTLGEHDLAEEMRRQIRMYSEENKEVRQLGDAEFRRDAAHDMRDGRWDGKWNDPWADKWDDLWDGKRDDPWDGKQKDRRDDKWGQLRDNKQDKPQKSGRWVSAEWVGVLLLGIVTAALLLAAVVPEFSRSGNLGHVGQADESMDGERGELILPDETAVGTVPPDDTGVGNRPSGGRNQNESVSEPMFSIQFPDSWKEAVGERQLAGGGREYYQKRSHDSMGAGTLCWIMVYQDYSYRDLPDYQVLGYDDSWIYVMSRPTDVQFDPDDPAAMEEYRLLETDVSQAAESFQILSDSAAYDGDEFVFVKSDSIYLREQDFLNLSQESLRLGKNEIYARHGRKFADPQLQQYFESCSWYEGTIEPDAFQESVLNDCERANIRMIQARQDG